MNAPLILLTRPRRESRWAARDLRLAGFEALRAPLQHTRVAAPSAALDADTSWALEASIQIFVSRASVAAACARAAGAVAAARHRFAVGASTAAALASQGHDCAVAPSGSEDSEGLLGLAHLQSVQGQRIALWVAPGGRERLVQTLTARGAEVRSIAVYRRVSERAPARIWRQLHEARQRAVLTATSAALLRELDRQLCRADLEQLRARPLIVASERIGRIAGELGYTAVVVAPGASSHALIAALAKLAIACRS